MQLHKHYLAILLSASLTGCLSGGGSFDVEEVEPTKVINNPADKKVTYKQAEKPNPEDFSEMGATFNSPIPINLLLLGEREGSLYTVNPDEQYVHIDEDYNQLTIRYPAKENNQKVIKEEKIDITIKPNNKDKNGKWDYLKDKGQYDLILDGSKNLGKFYADSKFQEAQLKLFTFDNTKVGFVRVKTPSSNDFWISSIFYRGKDKTTDVPISGTLSYKGYWAFATQLATDDTDKGAGGNGQETTIYTADFEANFSTKKLTGSLKGSDEHFNFDYKINANIKGNGFTGDASGKYDYKQGSAGSTEYTPTATVSGSFFGKGAAELAGKAIANDNAWAGVFAAKKENNSGTELKTDGDLFQAGVMTFTIAPPTSSTASTQPASEDNSSTSKSSDYQLEQYKKVNYSGNIDKLQVDGMLIDLTQTSDLNKACCSVTKDEENGLTTQSVKFGKYGYTKKTQNGSNTSNEDNKVGGYFVQGVLTPNSQVPNTGTSQYDGRWYGYAKDNTKGVFIGEALDAKFTAKWQEKQLEGKLFNKNQTGDGSLNFTATISGNSFTANNSKLEVATDTSKDSLNDTKITVNDIKVEGHFYGKNANELGGHFYSESKKAGGVFGAKQIETQSK
ncbi:transferrin-binding protein-like solute binding protein [Mergibacter septicus]|uniref:transferrin-binding protein-like solute binding protein n=1 Tax=Mergibacter septicus TaxID=221402 RepID=UPI0021C3EA73|nr:transferrin-binding protein-like solute binding protein [Mergibacter septicus]UTU47405.1 transferrin-binding protein-like solute binding protein [Mergibacter septicus]